MKKKILDLGRGNAWRNYTYQSIRWSFLNMSDEEDEN